MGWAGPDSCAVQPGHPETPGGAGEAPRGSEAHTHLGCAQVLPTQPVVTRPWGWGGTAQESSLSPLCRCRPACPGVDRSHGAWSTWASAPPRLSPRSETCSRGCERTPSFQGRAVAGDFSLFWRVLSIGRYQEGAKETWRDVRGRPGGVLAGRATPVRCRCSVELR